MKVVVESPIFYLLPPETKVSVDVVLGLELALIDVGQAAVLRAAIVVVQLP